MTRRLDTLITSRPRAIAALILILATALIIALAGLALELSEPDPEPYPSDDMPLEIVNGAVVYTNEAGLRIGGEIVPYTWMRVKFSVSTCGGSVTLPSDSFGNQSLLSTGVETSVHQCLLNSSYVVVNMNVTDYTGNGAFDDGDTIAFNLTPLMEDMVFTFGLLWTDDGGGGMAVEFSFAIHDGRLYSWSSNTLGEWYLPYI